jgi:hypothetical protein
MNGDETTVRIVLDDTSITAAQLASWVRLLAPDQFTLAEAMHIARYMIEGGGWEPPYWSVAYNLERLKGQPWSYTITTPPNEMAINFEKHSRAYKAGVELAALGAAGDAEAAIEFCKRFQAGDMANWCMG